MEEEGIVVVSCFDGMACARMALDVLGVKVKKYYAFEIDKYAMAVAKANYPNIIHLGDIRNASIKELSEERIDLICGGSPCQGFSFAGKQLAFDDPRSKLFFEFVRLVNECKELNPDVLFLLENVKMKREHELVISKYMGVSPIEINAALVSAQNRRRLFWTNINNKPYGLFGDMYCDIPQPKDKGILLKDILQPESEVDGKYYLKSETVEKLVQYRERQKNNGNGFTAKFHEQTEKMSTLKKGGAGCDDLIVAMRGRGENNDQQLEKKHHQQDELNYIDGKARCLVVGCHGNSKHFTKTVIPSVQKDNLVITENFYKGREERVFEGKSPTIRSGRSGLNVRQKANHKEEDGKANTFLSTSWKGSQANGMTLITQKARGFNDGSEKPTNGKCQTLSSNSWEHNNHLKNNSRIRRLTPRECARLQSIPEHIITTMLNCGVSDSQLYKMLGNGWNIEVIVHILSYAPFCKKD